MTLDAESFVDDAQENLPWSSYGRGSLGQRRCHDETFPLWGKRDALHHLVGQLPGSACTGHGSGMGDIDRLLWVIFGT